MIKSDATSPLLTAMQKLRDDIQRWYEVVGDAVAGLRQPTYAEAAAYQAIARQALRRLDTMFAGLAQTNGWQPMETAPKDGTRILLWVRGRWMQKAPVIITNWHVPDHMLYPPHWVGMIEGGPLFWQPLPAAPKE